MESLLVYDVPAPPTRIVHAKIVRSPLRQSTSSWVVYEAAEVAGSFRLQDIRDGVELPKSQFEENDSEWRHMMLRHRWASMQLL